jgi:hypothetical protein
MFSNEGVDNIAILELIKQHSKAFGLIVQRKHRLMHKREGTAAHFGQNSSLGNPILEDCQLQRFRSISPEVVSDRISVLLSCTKVSIHAPGFGFTIKAYICIRVKNVTLDRLGPQADQELGRLTFHGFPEVLDFLKKELLGIRSPRCLGNGNIDLSSNCFQLMLGVLELAAQGSN